MTIPSIFILCVEAGKLVVSTLNLALLSHLFSSDLSSKEGEPCKLCAASPLLVEGGYKLLFSPSLEESALFCSLLFVMVESFLLHLI